MKFVNQLVSPGHPSTRTCNDPSYPLSLRRTYRLEQPTAPKSLTLAHCVGIDSKPVVLFCEIVHLVGLIFVMTSRFFSSNLSNDGGIVEFAIALLNSVAH